MTQQIQTNVIFNHAYRFSRSNKKILIEQGGSRSGKTFNILVWVIFDYCVNNTGHIVTVCRKTFPSLRATVMRDFLDILKQNNLYNEKHHNKSNSEYTINGNTIEFISLDQPAKIRGRKRNLLFVNEANEIDWDSWQQLIFRTQGKIIIDYNPSEANHWIYDKVEVREDAIFYKTTYKDNPFIDKNIIHELERLKETDDEYWQVFGLGERALSRTQIFKFAVINKIPDTAKFISIGIDFGYTNDPTTAVEVYQDEHSIYINELLYRTMMTTADIHRFLLENNKGNKLCFGDSAEVRLIDELRRMGNNIRPSVKGQNSIAAGIDLLKRYKLNVTETSVNAIREFRDYRWKKDKANRLTNIPNDGSDHIPDAVRYATYSLMSKPNYGKYAIR